MVDLVGIDVYMSKIMMMKLRILTTSSDLVLGPTKSSPGINLFIYYEYSELYTMTILEKHN